MQSRTLRPEHGTKTSGGQAAGSWAPTRPIAPGGARSLGGASGGGSPHATRVLRATGAKDGRGRKDGSATEAARGAEAAATDGADEAPPRDVVEREDAREAMPGGRGRMTPGTGRVGAAEDAGIGDGRWFWGGRRGAAWAEDDVDGGGGGTEWLPTEWLPMEDAEDEGRRGA